MTTSAEGPLTSQELMTVSEIGVCIPCPTKWKRACEVAWVIRILTVGHKLLAWEQMCLIRAEFELEHILISP